MDQDDFVTFIAVGMVALVGVLGAYKIGRWHERRVLTPYIATNIEKAYWEGWDDGNKTRQLEALHG